SAPGRSVSPRLAPCGHAPGRAARVPRGVPRARPGRPRAPVPLALSPRDPRFIPPAAPRTAPAAPPRAGSWDELAAETDRHADDQAAVPIRRQAEDPAGVGVVGHRARDLEPREGAVRVD